MRFALENQGQLDRLAECVRCASAPDARLFEDVIANGCQRAAPLIRMGKAAQLQQLIDAGAWTEAALALLEIELAQWKPRRIVFDDGEWHCRLSAQPYMPEGFDDVVDTCHDVLALSILGALVAARRQLAGDDRQHSSVPDRVPVNSDCVRVCCDNFG
jgi:hypothetical protein